MKKKEEGEESLALKPDSQLSHDFQNSSVLFGPDFFKSIHANLTRDIPGAKYPLPDPAIDTEG